MSSLSNELAAQAEDVKALVAEADAAAITSITKSLEAGALLIAAKDSCGHGNWLPFLKRAGVQERKAQRLMKVAKSGFTSDCVSELGGITSALRFLDERRPPKIGDVLCITPVGFSDDWMHTIDGALIWQSTAPSDEPLYHCAVIRDLNIAPTYEKGVQVQWLPFPAPLESTHDVFGIWDFVDTLFTRRRDWHFHRAGGDAREVIAEGMGIASALFMAMYEAEDERRMADAARIALMLDDLGLVDLQAAA